MTSSAIGTYPSPWMAEQAHPSADAMSAMIIRTFPGSARSLPGTRHQQPELRMEPEPQPIAVGDREPLPRLDGLAVDPCRARGIRWLQPPLPLAVLDLGVLAAHGLVAEHHVAARITADRHRMAGQQVFTGLALLTP